MDNALKQLFANIPEGKLIHATQEVNGEWKRDTRLYQWPDGTFFFEQSECDGDAGRNTLYFSESELKEHVAKLLPILFTPEELKKLCEGSAPGGA